MSESPYSHEVTAENFEKIVIQGSRQAPVLVDFWAEWGQPCKMLMPVLETLADDYRGKFILAKINTEEQQGLAAQFAIRSIPTVKLFKDGQPVDEFMGALPEAELRKFLDRHIPRESDNLVAQARLLLQQGETAAAQDILTRARAEDPDNPQVGPMLIELHAQLGDIDSAEAEIEALPLDQREKPEITALRARLQFARIAAQTPTAEARAGEPDLSSETSYRLAAHKVLQEDYETALQMLLELMKKDRQYGDDAARKAMLSLFEMLGTEHPLVGQYRNKLFNLLH